VRAHNLAETTMDTSTLPGIGIKPLLSLRRHYRASLAIAALVVLIGIPFAWIKGQSFYIAESVFQVAPSYMKNLEADKELELQSNSQYREYVNHLSSSVTRYDVLERALADLKQRGIDTRPPELTERKYIERLQKTVYVRAIPDTYMVRVGIENSDRSHLDTLVNAITASFLKTTRTEQIYGSGERLKMLEESAARLNAEVKELEAERVVLADKLGLTTFGESTQNPYDGMLAQTRERLTAATTDRVQADAALAAFDRQREIPTSFNSRSLLEMRLQDDGLQALRNETVKRTEDLTRTIAGLEPKHPARQTATAELAAIKERVKTAEAEFDRQTFSNFRGRLVATQGQRAQVEKELQANLVTLEGKATEFARNFQQAMRLTGEIKKRDAELTKLRERLSYLETESQALGFVRVVNWALPPETPMGIGKTRLLLVVLAAALASGLALPVALDLMDRRIRSVNEAEGLMGMPAAGWQVRTEDLPTQLFAEEQVRRFASTLMRNRARGGRRTFAFTSVKPGAGVTTSILDTARVLVRLGARVLVVEANAFAPFAGFGAAGPGLSEYLAGSAELAELPRSFAWRDATLEVVAIGGEGRDGLRRLDRLQEAMVAWSTSYDYVLVDLPPLLLSADAEMLVDALGQVFLMLEAEAVSRGEITRAKRLLQKLDPEAVGLFVSKVPVFHGAGYMEELMAETLTQKRFEHFMSLARWRLWWEVLRLKMAARPRGGA
jgi:succinoglycan biosynthesis transport protein ExoP